jgi:hypothetical protein
MSFSATRSGTQSSTLSNVIKVTRKVQADVLAIHDTYGHFSEAYAQELIRDLRVFLDEEVIAFVSFVWTTPSTRDVLDAIRYTVMSGSTNLADDRPGGISYNRALKDARFQVRVTYNDRWARMTDSEKEAIRARLSPGWGPAAALNYGAAAYVSDRTYSPDGQYGVSRERLTR